MQGNRFACSRCGESIYNVTVDGKPAPIVFYMVAGLHPEYAPDQVDLNALAIPQWLRELLVARTPRADLCVNCVIVTFRTPGLVPSAKMDKATAEQSSRMAVVPREMNPTERDVLDKARVMAALEKPPKPSKAKPKAVRSQRTGRRSPVADTKGQP